MIDKSVDFCDSEGSEFTVRNQMRNKNEIKDEKDVEKDENINIYRNK